MRWKALISQNKTFFTKENYGVSFIYIGKYKYIPSGE
jgi:hypothetical protein